MTEENEKGIGQITSIVHSFSYARWVDFGAD